MSKPSLLAPRRCRFALWTTPILVAALVAVAVPTPARGTPHPHPHPHRHVGAAHRHDGAPHRHADTPETHRGPRSSTPVLPPSAATEVSRLLELSRPIRANLPLRAQIQADHVLVTAGPTDHPELRVTLVHPKPSRPGVIVVGDVGLSPLPGPSPKALMDVLLTRLRAAKGVLTWQIPPAKPRVPAPAAPAATRTKLLRAMVRSSTWVAAGDSPRAQRALQTVPAPTAPEPLAAYAVAWARAGDAKRAAALVRTFPQDASPAYRLVAAALRGEALTAEQVTQRMGSAGHCHDAGAAEQLHLLGRHLLAVRVAHVIRTAGADCAAAWTAEIHARGDLPPSPVAQQAVASALKRHPANPKVLEATASLARRHGDTEGTIARYERLARLDPTRAGTLGHLTNALMHEGADRPALLRSYEAKHRKDPNDEVNRFVLGVLLHYADDYTRSNAVFRPLEGRRDAEDRLHVYMAMNDFNLGDRESALARLERVATGNRPDPDVFYCRAEIERDAHRPRAIADLRRYLASSSGTDSNHAIKERRVRKMIGLLEVCEKEERAICEGPWEHPRAQRLREAQRLLWYRVGLGLCAVLGVLGAAWLWRRRRSAAA